HTRSKRDWSSDVCSSDLRAQVVALLLRGTVGLADQEELKSPHGLRLAAVLGEEGAPRQDGVAHLALRLGGSDRRGRPPWEEAGRSEERRVGKECRSWEAV